MLKRYLDHCQRTEKGYLAYVTLPESVPASSQETAGKLQATDPRLGPLPAGWRLRNHELEESLN